MAVFAITTHQLTFNAVDLTDHVKSVTLSMEAAQLDSTAMGDTWVEQTGGLKSGTLAITFNDDYAASSVDTTLWSAFNTGTVVTFSTKPTSAATSATNPSYSGSVLPSQHSIGGGVGELAAKTVSFPLSGAVTRATA